MKDIKEAVCRNRNISSCQYFKVRQEDVKVFRVIWWILFGAGLAGTLYQVFSLALAIREFKVVTTIEISREDAIEFPSMTFCNKNRVHCGHLLKTILDCERVR